MFAPTAVRSTPLAATSAAALLIHPVLINRAASLDADVLVVHSINSYYHDQ